MGLCLEHTERSHSMCSVNEIPILIYDDIIALLISMYIVELSAQGSRISISSEEPGFIKIAKRISNKNMDIEDISTKRLHIEYEGNLNYSSEKAKITLPEIWDNTFSFANCSFVYTVFSPSERGRGLVDKAESRCLRWKI